MRKVSIIGLSIKLAFSLFQVCNWIKKKYINNKYFVYFGTRRHEKSIVEAKFIRRILGGMMSLLTNIILNIKIKDTQCGYKLYKKSIAKPIFFKMKDYGFNHDLEIILLLQSKDIQIKELPIKWKHKDNSRLNVFWDPIKMFIGIFAMRFRYF